MCSINDIRSFALRAIKTVLIVVGLSLPIETLWAVPASCNATSLNNIISNNSIPDIIAYNTSGTTNTYCELCGIGQVRIVVTNPTNKDMTDFVVKHVFDSDELEYVANSTNGNPAQNPVISANTPVAGSTTLTWTQSEIAALAKIDGVSGNSYNTVEILFNIKSKPNFEEDLVLGPTPTDRDIQAFANFNFCEAPSTVTPGGVSTTKIPLPINEPEPNVVKQGRNVDAGQNGYSTNVYGNIHDDVIWRIRINNPGLADLQDLRFDDLMASVGAGDNFDIKYICPTEGDAESIANANGAADPQCFLSSDNISDYVVANTFGDSGTSYDGHDIDVLAGGSIDIFLVGKILNSCDDDSTNTVSDVQWGCEADNSPASSPGGILQPSTGAAAITSTARLESFVVNSGLQVTRALTGLDTNDPVGSRGLMTITVRNNTGGTIIKPVLTNTLPDQYVVDQSFTPTLTMTSSFGDYDGRADVLNVAAAPADPLDYNEPVFTLTSPDVNYTLIPADNQIDLMRQGDVAVIRFRVVMIPLDPTTIPYDHYDNVANMDITPEDPSDNNTDPVNKHNTTGDELTNNLVVTFTNFCDGPGTPQTLTFNDTTIESWPEDLDLSIPNAGGEVFILTDTQDLDLTVNIINNGGHYADDYTAYVTFGATMDVVSFPSNCTNLGTSRVGILDVWDDPADIPATATVIQCTHNNAPNGLGPIPGVTGMGVITTIPLNFTVRKTTDNARILLDDLTFRADVVGEIRLSDGSLTGSGALLTFPTPQTTLPVGNEVVNRANNYSLDSVRAKVIGFNLTKTQVGNCSENNPPTAGQESYVEIGEECTFHVESGGWFGFETPGYTYIAVQKIQVDDQLPDGQGFISTSDPSPASTSAIKSITLNPTPAPLSEGTFSWQFNQNVNTERITTIDEWFRMDATTRILNGGAAPNLHTDLSRNTLVSTFEAVFNNIATTLDEEFLLGPGTIGYPDITVRRADLTITEPNIIVTKEVCNETLYGVGTGCSEFHQTINDGDTQDSYIYRITLENKDDADSPTGVTRAPAYNVTATDTLDASDLMLVKSFATDGLDNDGDGLTDEADEGTISENNIYVAPGPPAPTPALLTFSHTHSTALLKIEPGPANRVFLYYRIDPDDAISPEQELINNVYATYDSLYEQSGNQTINLPTLPQSNNDAVGGARTYTSATASATVEILPLENQPKTIRFLSNTAPAVGTQGVSIGEEIEYQLRTFIPVANLRQFKISDVLPSGISCAEAPVVDLDATPYSAAGFVPGGKITPTCTNNLVEWDFGDQELTKAINDDRFDFSVRFIARIDNSSGVNDNDTISNGGIPATNVSYRNQSNVLVSEQFSQLDVRVDEPNILLTKAYEAGNHDAGDVITVTVTAENIGTATAYNLRVFDDLDAVSSLTFMNVTGADPPDVDLALGTNRPIFKRNIGDADYDIIPGETISFTFEIRVDRGAQPHEILNNTIQAVWQSLPDQATSLNTTNMIGTDGSSSGMRNAVIPFVVDAINDYKTTATTSSTVPSVTATKTDLDPTTTPAPTYNTEIGLHKNYEIVINLPEGTTENLIVNDNLNFSDISYVLTRDANYDVSYTFNGIATINNGQFPSEASLISAAPLDGATGTLIWNFGKVVTDTEDDTTGGPSISPNITINYYARVDNSITTNAGDRLQNQANTNYTNGETPATTEVITNNTPRLTVIESEILLANVTKVATAITPGQITGGHIIRYVITVPNSGNATAYDLNIVDTLPADLDLYLEPGFEPTVSINGVQLLIANGFKPIPTNSPSGPLIWGRGNGDNTFDIPDGQSLILTYYAIIEAGAESNINYINSAVIDWTSLNNTITNSATYERTGAGAGADCSAIVAPNDYCVGPITSTITTADTNSLTKAITYDSYATNNDAIVRIGDEVTYQLSLNLQEGTTRNVNVQDVLPAGLEFVKIISINGDTVADYDPPGSGDGSNFSYSTIAAASLPLAGATGTINFSLGNVINDPLNTTSTIDTLVIEYQARVLNDTLSETPTTQTLTNTATLQYIDGSGAAVIAPGRLESSAILTVLQPNLEVTKTSGAAIVQIGTPVSYSITVLNSGDSPAYNLTVTDVLPTFDPAVGGMCDTTPTSIVARMYLADGITPATGAALILGTDYEVNYSGCILILTMQSTTDATLVAGNNLIITYDANVDTDTPHTTPLTNVAGATQWFSQDAAGATSEIQTYTKTLTNGTTGTPDHEDASTVTTDTPTVTVEKLVYNVTQSQSGATAVPGDVLRYTINITNTSSVELFDFSFTDELDGLNSGAWFASNTLKNLTTVPAGADITNTDAAGGAKGTGLVDVRNLNLGTVPGNNTVVIEFEVELAPSIPDGTTVENQGSMTTNGTDFLTDDDLTAGGVESTKTLISSAPLFKVEKVSTDLTGDPNILLTGDTLRYTITVKNTGTEDTINSILRDQLPANTTYVAGSTTLNGNVVTEPIPGTLPLQAGILINTPANLTAGYMVADGSGTDLSVGAYSTIIFDVTINNNVVNGTVISNQGYVSAESITNGAIADTPSDDPSTPTIPNDPTRDVVGDQPLLDAHKTASISYDANNNGFLDIGDEIRYTITISNTGAVPATGVRFTDAIPTYTQYVDDSVTLNTLPVGQPDGGVSPLIAGIPVSSSDLTAPLPTAGNGIISVGQTAVIAFDVRYDTVPPVVNYISNQGFVYSNEQPVEPTDADGIDSNGDQPTLIAIGNGQLLTITKSASVVGGGPVVAGGQLEYRILVTNISTVDATNVEITDNLDLPVAGQLTYVIGSALLNGLPDGIDDTALPIIKADYDAPYGNLASGQTAELVFRVDVNNALPIGTTISNTGNVFWNAATQTDSATISVDVGGTPGVANVNGKVWHDKNYDNIFDAGEIELANWYVDIYRNSTLLGTVTTDTNGNYSINGLIPNYIGMDRYDIRFRSPGSNSTTAKLGLAYSDPALTYINALHRIYDIVLNSGANVQNLNLPIDPNGVVYNSVNRTAIPGATISLLNAVTGNAVPSSCFDDDNQQNQITTENGYYKFDLNFSHGECNAGINYLIKITPPAVDYSLLPSTVITPQTDASTAALNVPGCPGTADDDVVAPPGYCEVQVSEVAPSLSVPPASAGTSYYLHLTLDDVSVPGDSQIFNNHLPIDPILVNAVSITKISPMVNVTRGKLVPYTITITNRYGVDLNNSSIIDNFPAGFKYIEGSARYNNGTTEVQLEPVRNGLTLTWANIDLPVDQTQTFKLLLIVGAGVKEGPYSNKAHVFDTLTNTLASGTAVATVRVTADPDFDCSHVIGKVYDDKNLNGYQDTGEKGLSGVKFVTVRGLVSTSDKHGRFHVTCAVVPNEDRGSNFVIKLDERTLPSGYRMTTENPRVQRVTRGKMAKFNFGSSLHRVVSMDLADGVFVSNSTDMNSQWIPRIDLLIKQLKEKPSILRLSYLADVDDEDLVEDRLAKVKQDIIEKWLVDDKYKLSIETEIFWRRGGPPDRGGID